MFTGIIQEVGKIAKITKLADKTQFQVNCQKVIQNKQIGDSIAVNGACMTVTQITSDFFTFDAIPESLAKTNLSKLKESDLVNLEPALTLNQSLDGHIVQGHVDCIGTVKDIKESHKGNILQISYPTNIKKYLALKGSITINGVSLTISGLDEDSFTVSLIPHTLKETNLGTLKQDQEVNLEIDIIARYLESLIAK